MKKQSTRVKITPWSFQNQYTFGDFGGDGLEMLRRGYDIHLRFADFGIRKLLIRFKEGLPHEVETSRFLHDDRLTFIRDEKGPGGILSIVPFIEPGMDWVDIELDEIVERLVPLRDEILNGDLRPLYLADLAIAIDDEHSPDETTECPVPAGLDQLTDAQKALAEFHNISNWMLAAVAQASPPLKKIAKPSKSHEAWLKSQSVAQKDKWLIALLEKNPAEIQRKILLAFESENPTGGWPVKESSRTIKELEKIENDLAEAAEQAMAVREAEARKLHLQELSGNPKAALRKIDDLIGLKSRDAYQQVADLLSDLKEALACTDQSDLARTQARELKKKYPSRQILHTTLKQAGLLGK